MENGLEGSVEAGSPLESFALVQGRDDGCGEVAVKMGIAR